MVAWVAVGLGTALLGVAVIYWQDVKSWFRREKVVVSERTVPPKLNVSVEQIVSGALAWVGCHRYTYLCCDGVEGVIWAHTDEAAWLILERYGCSFPILRRTKWETPQEGDLVVYDEEVYP